MERSPVEVFTLIRYFERPNRSGSRATTSLSSFLIHTFNLKKRKSHKRLFFEWRLYLFEHFNGGREKSPIWELRGFAGGIQRTLENVPDILLTVHVTHSHLKNNNFPDNLRSDANALVSPQDESSAETREEAFAPFLGRHS
jgi:hypothetical protein